MTEILHITHVVLSLDVGGLERVVLSLIREGVRMGHRVSVLCVERPGELAGEAEAAGASVWSAGKLPGVKLKTIETIRAHLAEQRPDVVHTHQIGALFYAGPAARRAGVPVIVHTEHGKHYERNRRRRWLGWWAGRSAQRFICVSKDIAAGVVRRGVALKGKVQVVHNGIDTRKFARLGDGAELRAALDIPAEAAVVGTVGRLAEVKRQEVLIRAIAAMSGAERGAPYAVIVGAGPREAELREVAVDLGVAERVRFAGYQSAPERFLAMMDVFALTSQSEGMPLVVLEAWAAGVPVVTSRVGGLPDLIQEGQTGLMFEAGDVAGLVRHLDTLLTDKARAKAMGEAGQQYVRATYDVATMSADYLRHYMELQEGAACLA